MLEIVGFFNLVKKGVQGAHTFDHIYSLIKVNCGNLLRIQNLNGTNYSYFNNMRLQNVLIYQALTSLALSLQAVKNVPFNKVMTM